MGQLSDRELYAKYAAWCQQIGLDCTDFETWQRTRNTVSEAVLEHERGAKRRPSAR